ncbi:hypothetical protein A7U60_g3020 [Sanghuangporus baumii]|uniref:Ferric reductase n=1 Tax=Sanghuangporus baumii TaxID=108892 RepID=A0A9Q5N7D3_SANBA|nr:hypothetical protein A7U60_g3020 [Sanghuangporus baumii]
MSDVAPSIPTEYQVYNSYETDPTYQRKFSIVWASAAAFFFLAALPTFIWSLKSGRFRDALLGVREDSNSYEPIAAGTGRTKQAGSSRFERVSGWVSALKAPTTWTVPLLGLDIGQLILVVAYYITVVLCIVLNAELVDNPNRAGFLAIAQLPPVFLFATKNSPLGILLSSGYEKINFLHRWAGRGTLLAAAIHGALWIRNHLEYGVQILGAQKETSGVAAFALLCVLAITSVRPIRIHVYQVFRLIHILVVPACVITMCYHTTYMAPYVYPILAFYGFDLFLRLVRYRVKDATLIAPDAQMTIVRVHDCSSGWSVGQHVRLRIFVANRMFESHPLTIMNAPQATTCLGDIGVNHEMLLGARVQGDWTRALNAYARENNFHLDTGAGKEAVRATEQARNVVIENEVVVENVQEGVPVNVAHLPAPSKTGKDTTETIATETQWPSAGSGALIQVMLDGPYGGCAIDLGSFERVLLVAGGSGVTSTLGLLDDLVGRIVKLGRRGGEVTQRVEFVWCVRSFGALRWVAPFLSAIASRATASPDLAISLHIDVYVTCLCKPEEVPYIPNCDVLVEKPSVRRLVDGLLASFASGAGAVAGSAMSETDPDPEKPDSRVPEGADRDWKSLAVCAAGPESLTAEAKNAAARVALRHPGRRVECHSEAYFL